MNKPAAITGRGGARPGAGRKPLDSDGGDSLVYQLRVTREQRAKIEAIGGADRLRQFIDRAYAAQQSGAKRGGR